MCILGGGFGGLYTALRLESLVWPDDKKPQVIMFFFVRALCCKRLKLLNSFLIRWFWLTSLNVLCSSRCCMSFSLEVRLSYASRSIFGLSVCV